MQRNTLFIILNIVLQSTAFSLSYKNENFRRNSENAVYSGITYTDSLDAEPVENHRKSVAKRYIDVEPSEQSNNEDADIFVAEILPEGSEDFQGFLRPLGRYRKDLLGMNIEIENANDEYPIPSQIIQPEKVNSPQDRTGEGVQIQSRIVWPEKTSPRQEIPTNYDNFNAVFTTTPAIRADVAAKLDEYHRKRISNLESSFKENLAKSYFDVRSQPEGFQKGSTSYDDSDFASLHVVTENEKPAIGDQNRETVIVAPMEHQMQESKLKKIAVITELKEPLAKLQSRIVESVHERSRDPATLHTLLAETEHVKNVENKMVHPWPQSSNYKFKSSLDESALDEKDSEVQSYGGHRRNWFGRFDTLGKSGIEKDDYTQDETSHSKTDLLTVEPVSNGETENRTPNFIHNHDSIERFHEASGYSNLERSDKIASRTYRESKMHQLENKIDDEPSGESGSTGGDETESAGDTSEDNGNTHSSRYSSSDFNHKPIFTTIQPTKGIGTFKTTSAETTKSITTTTTTNVLTTAASKPSRTTREPNSAKISSQAFVTHEPAETNQGSDNDEYETISKRPTLHYENRMTSTSRSSRQKQREEEYQQSELRLSHSSAASLPFQESLKPNRSQHSPDTMDTMTHWNEAKLKQYPSSKEADKIGDSVNTSVKLRKGSSDSESTKSSNHHRYHHHTKQEKHVDDWERMLISNKARELYKELEHKGANKHKHSRKSKHRHSISRKHHHSKFKPSRASATFKQKSYHIKDTVPIKPSHPSTAKQSMYVYPWHFLTQHPDAAFNLMSALPVRQKPFDNKKLTNRKGEEELGKTLTLSADKAEASLQEYGKQEEEASAEDENMQLSKSNAEAPKYPSEENQGNEYDEDENPARTINEKEAEPMGLAENINLDSFEGKKGNWPTKSSWQGKIENTVAEKEKEIKTQSGLRSSKFIAALPPLPPVVDLDDKANKDALGTNKLKEFNENESIDKTTEETDNLDDSLILKPLRQYSETANNMTVLGQNTAQDSKGLEELSRRLQQYSRDKNRNQSLYYLGDTSQWKKHPMVDVNIKPLVGIFYKLHHENLVDITEPKDSFKHVKEIAPAPEGMISDTLRWPQRIKYYKIPNAEKLGAVCMDGSGPGYYMRRGFGSAKDKWIVHLHGGAWCYSPKTCLKRRNSLLGSTKHWYAEQIGNFFHGILSDNTALNPNFHDWNVVVQSYCDGGLFSGNRLKPFIYKGKKMYFRGRPILTAMLEDLKRQGIVNASDIILSGTSAGGLAVILQGDYMRSRLPRAAKVRGLVDAGFFLDAPSKSGENIARNQFKGIYFLHHPRLRKKCLLKHKHNESYLCLFPENTVKYTKVPTFFVSPLYDHWQLSELQGLNCVYNNDKCKPEERDKILMFRNKMYSTLNSAINSVRRSGIFANSCIAHGQAILDYTWSRVRVKNQTIADSFYDWFSDKQSKRSHRNTDCRFPCNGSCPRPIAQSCVENFKGATKKTRTKRNAELC